MRKLVLGLAAAGAALAVATPASAQYYGGGYGYNGGGYGYNGYNGYNREYGDASGFHRRIYNVMNSLGGVRPDRVGMIRAEAIGLDRELRYAARNGLNPYEARNFDVRIGQLERHLQYASVNRGYGGYGNYGYNGGYYNDRDRDGRDDRWEHRRDRDDDDRDD